jgi:hypothetical protein
LEGGDTGRRQVIVGYWGCNKYKQLVAMSITVGNEKPWRKTIWGEDK